jgi:hypothetical protein
LLIGLIVCTATASAQSAASAVVLPPQTDSFPRIRAYLDVHDAQGEFIHGVQASQLRIFENGRSLPVAEFSELRPGVQLVFALSPGEPFAIRNSQGTSRYDFVRTALLDWAKGRQGSTLDDLSLLATAGPELTHFNDSLQMVSALESYQPDLETSLPGLDILLRAIDLTADAAPRPGMERVVVLVTAPPQGDISFGLQELISRAIQLRVRIFVWVVASPQALSSQPVSLLARLAEGTGGQFFTYSGEEAVPDLESYFSRLRDVYSFSYDSQITSGGTQQLAVEVQVEDQVIASEPVNFEFDLLPPEPAFLSPEPEVQRALAPGPRNPLQPINLDELAPREQRLQVLVEFPDGRIRPLVHTALFVDGLLVDENRAPPYEVFTWDLSEYTTDGQHLLQVEVEDSLGLKGASIVLPVLVDVELPRPNPLSGLLLRWPLLVGLVVALASAAILLGLVLSGKISPRLASQLGFRRGRSPRIRRPLATTTPLAERLRGEIAGRRLPNWVNRLQWPQRRLHPKAHAYLSSLTEAGEGRGMAPISIAMDELTFGLDPNLATVILDDASVEGLHARLLHEADGSFRLIDEGSVAGTWVNYLPVGEQGQVLEHGDLVHFGRVGFRFNQREPVHASKPVITSLAHEKNGQASGEQGLEEPQA